MEQPKLEVKQVPVLRLVIEYTPTTGEFRVGWPPCDEVGHLGMLEMAKQILTEARVKRSGSNLVVPSRVIQ